MSEQRKQRLSILALVCIVIVQIFYITSVFTAREGYHSDEVYSYEFANNYYDEYVAFAPVESYDSLSTWSSDPNNAENSDEWLSTQVLFDAATVQDGQRFCYGSVLYNQQYDLNPPLHSLLLHTICSFFPNTFSWWYAYVINIIAFVGAQICLFLLARLLLRSRWLALIVPLYYGFTTLALNNFIYLRPYALLIFFTLLWTLLVVRLWKKDFRRSPVMGAALGVVTFLGCYTNLYFGVFVCVVTLCFCVYLAVRKRWAACFVFGGCVLVGALVMVAFSATMFSSLLHQESGYEKMTDPFWKLMTCAILFLTETVGIHFDDYNVFFICIIALVLLLVLLFAAFLFLARRETWYLRMLGAIKTFFLRIGAKFKRIAHESTSTFWPILFLFIAFSITFIIISQSVNVSGMKQMTNRYLSLLGPIFVLLMIWVLWQVAERIAPKRRFAGRAIFAGVLATLLVCCNLMSGCDYAFKRYANYDGTIAETVEDADVIVVSSMQAYLGYWAPTIDSASEYFFVPAYRSKECCEALSQLDNEKPVYLVVESRLFLTDSGYIASYDATDETQQQLAALGYMNGVGFSISDMLDYWSESVSWMDKREYIGAEAGFTGIVYLVQLR